MTAAALPDTFESARLRMRLQEVSDAEALHEAYGDAALMTWWSSAPHPSVERTRDYLTRSPDEAPFRGWVMIEAASGAVIGTLAAYDKRPGVTEIGYLLIRRFWGHGYAREGVERLVALIFAAGARKVIADTDPDNAASNALLERLGFTCEARLRAEWETHIGVRDSLMWGLLRDEWRG
ncbi:Protein N-acetyltransferase, RimJ/RimL family [Sphingomonas guangdongensis]|uniref:Protein N-acetyltransferase, RimJ/RimL family n=1 Tax=Sphingomonas guangdongensis TaxID=1141890 RepID=A0A285R7K1_9SPHN|nr:GNAT family N-acetyltransferase [Sphingomonas guangdongensis]SOB88337.1 Protein N-acetyltransferase, RimJ/RimL family [Sphingomonas guangdongensis]